MKNLTLTLLFAFIQITIVNSQTTIELTNREIVNGFVGIEALINGMGYTPSQIVKKDITKIIVKKYRYKFGEIDKNSEEAFIDFNFDNNGNLLNIDNKRTLAYNEKGYKISDYSYSESHSYTFEGDKISKHTHSWNNGKNSRVYKYKYNTKSRIIKKIGYDENGNAVSYESKNYGYNSKGLLITVKSDYTYGSQDGLKEKYTYDTRNNLIKVERFYTRGNEVYTFKYNSKNQVIEETHKESFSHTKIENKYDTDGKKIKSVHYNSSGEPYRVFKYFYE